jgi:serine/threonine protein kinase/DNA-directed RNA polymerase subunit RPC12/RpoP
MLEQTQSGKDQYIAAWLIKQKCLKPESLKAHYSVYKRESPTTLFFLEWLVQHQWISFESFESVLKEFQTLTEYHCSSCQKKVMRKIQETPPLCKECHRPLEEVKAPSKKDFLVGTTLGNCFIVRKLGQGGMGTVYLAFYLKLKKWVALKILPLKGEQTDLEEKRFQLEAESASRMEHPHIVQVLDAGVEKDFRYMIQYFVEGPSLENYLKQKGRLSIEEVLPLARGIAEGLDYAHRLGIVHRDIKPANIMLTLDKTPKITDFGLVKILGESPSFSVTGTIIGTPQYASPEQSEGKSLDARTDIYSLGVLLFQMVTGKIPYDADSQMAILYKHIHDPIPNSHMMCNQVDEYFAQIISKCMAKKPEGRFKNCQELLNSFEAYQLGKWESLLPSVSKTYETSRILLPGLSSAASEELHQLLPGLAQASLEPATLSQKEGKQGLTCFLFLIGICFLLILLREILSEFLS